MSKIFLVPWQLSNSGYTTAIKHTKPVKAPAYTHALPDIGNKEWVDMLIEHSANLLVFLCTDFSCTPPSSILHDLEEFLVVYILPTILKYVSTLLVIVRPTLL